MPVDDDVLRSRIIQALMIYPRLSPSMLQVGIGTAVPSSMWRPTLERLILENVVLRTQLPVVTMTGRHKNCEILELSPDFRVMIEANVGAKINKVETIDTDDTPLVLASLQEREKILAETLI